MYGTLPALHVVSHRLDSSPLGVRLCLSRFDLANVGELDVVRVVYGEALVSRLRAVALDEPVEPVGDGIYDFLVRR